MTITKAAFHRAHALLNPTSGGSTYSDLPEHGREYSAAYLSHSPLVSALERTLARIDDVQTALRKTSRGKAKGGPGHIEPKMYAYWDALQAAKDAVLECECPIPGRESDEERQEVEMVQLGVTVAVERVGAVLKRTLESEKYFKQLNGGNWMRRNLHRGSWITAEHWTTLAGDLNEVVENLGKVCVPGTRLM